MGGKSTIDNIKNAHLACVRWASEQGHELAFVAEDDVHFTSMNSWRVFYAAAVGLKSYDVLLGGIYHDDVPQPIRGTDLARVSRFSGLHLYAVPVRLLPMLEKAQGNIDAYMSAHLKDKYVCWPFVAIQHPGWSMKDKRHTDHSRLVNKRPILKDA
jgi:hypothetical protein